MESTVRIFWDESAFGTIYAVNMLLEDKKIKVVFDDEEGCSVSDIIIGVNRLLKDKKIQLVFDDEEHDGFQILSIKECAYED